MPISNPIFNVFGRSPIHPLQEHMNKAYECVKTLSPFFEQVLVKNWKQATQLQQKIDQLEDEADKLKIEIRLHLPKGLFLPVHRSDILELLHTQDAIANRAEDIAGLILGRQMQFPESIVEDFKTMLARSIEAAQQARKAIGELHELLESGFRGNEVKIVEKMIRVLDKIEDDTDDMQVTIRGKIFALENDLPPVHVMFLYKITEWVGDLADRSHRVGGQLQLLLAR